MIKGNKMTEATNTIAPGALAALAAAAGASNKNVSQGAAAAVAGDKKKREVSPQAQAALEAFRQRTTLAVGVLEVIERDHPNMVDELTKAAQKHIAEQAEARAAAEAERKANLAPRGTALAEYRKKTNAALALMQSLQDKGINIDDLLAKATAVDAQAGDQPAE